MAVHYTVILLAPLVCSALGADEFNCQKLPPLTRPAATVYELRPQDIKVLMAMGDSVTAAFGAGGRNHSVIKDLYEYRGQSWSIGGDLNASTIGTFLRHYNPDIIGLSVGSHFVEYCNARICPINQYRPSMDRLNAAQSGALISNLVKHEFKYLYEELTKNSRIDMKNDWKMLTIFIGANDLCESCNGNSSNLTADDYEKHLHEVLEEIRIKIPRVFVNVVELFNLSIVYERGLQSTYCTKFHRFFSICSCGFSSGKEGNRKRREMDNLVVQYNERIRKIANNYSQKKYPEFAVVAQPGLRDGTRDSIPMEFLSDLDCFHPSFNGHRALAKTIWNNMVTPAAKKKSTFNYKDEPFVCPTNATLLYVN